VTDINEPADGGCVALQYRLDPSGMIVYRRDDQAAADAGKPDERWFAQAAGRFERPLTWEALTFGGPVAYVGEFINRGWLP
jgi:hypothetical protein